MGEKRVGFHENEQKQDYSDGENENDKRPVSKLHRRDTPHHLKNKRVQQHLTDKAANVILNKLKEMPPQPVIDEVSPHIEVNPMPLVQDVGLPIIEHYPEMTQNGIEIPAHPNGKFLNSSLLVKKLFHKYAMSRTQRASITKIDWGKGRKSFMKILRLGIESEHAEQRRERNGIFISSHHVWNFFPFLYERKSKTNGGIICYHRDKRFLRAGDEVFPPFEVSLRCRESSLAIRNVLAVRHTIAPLHLQQVTTVNRD